VSLNLFALGKRRQERTRRRNRFDVESTPLHIRNLAAEETPQRDRHGRDMDQFDLSHANPSALRGHLQHIAETFRHGRKS
jgi:hypothetical protein